MPEGLTNASAASSSLKVKYEMTKLAALKQKNLLYKHKISAPDSQGLHRLSYSHIAFHTKIIQVLYH